MDQQLGHRRPGRVNSHAVCRALSDHQPQHSAAVGPGLTPHVCLKAKINLPCLEPQSSHSAPDRWETPHNQQTQVCDNYGLPARISRRAFLLNMSVQKHCGWAAVNTGPLWSVDTVSRVSPSLSSMPAVWDYGPTSYVDVSITDPQLETCTAPRCIASSAKTNTTHPH